MHYFYSLGTAVCVVAVLGTVGSCEQGEIGIVEMLVRLAFWSLVLLLTLWMAWREEACANERKKSNNCWKQNCPRARS